MDTLIFWTAIAGFVAIGVWAVITLFDRDDDSD